MKVNRNQNGCVIIINNEPRVYATYDPRIEQIYHEYTERLLGIVKKEEYERLNQNTNERIKEILGEPVDSKFRSYYNSLLESDLEGNLYVKGNDIPMPKKLAHEIKKIKSENEYRKLISLVRFWKRLISIPKPEYKRPFMLDLNKINSIVNYIFRETSDLYVYNRLIEQGFSHDFAFNESLKYECGITQSGYLSTYKVITSRNYIYEYDEEGNPHRVPLFQEVKLDKMTGEKIITEKSRFAEDEIFEPAIYKNGEKFYCDEQLSYIIKLGKRHYFDNFDSVNCNDYSTCVKGLHVGGISYVRSWRRDNSPIAEVLVAPEDIGAVSASEEVLRVREYYVHNIIGSSPNKGFYNTATYGNFEEPELLTMKYAKSY